MCLFYNIPNNLKNLPNWVVTNGSKIPLNPNNPTEQARIDRPETWSTFGTAKTLLDIKMCDNVGFVFSNNGYVGIDIDNGVEDGKISSQVMSIISDIGSYAEFSKSGRGIHVIVKGILPMSGRNNQKGFEIYQDKRYFIMTGKVIEGFETIIENQQAIDKFLDEYFDIKIGVKSYRQKIYSPRWDRPSRPLKIKCEYPMIQQGSRNVSLLSLAGQLRKAGMSRIHIIRELIRCNKEACDPKLELREIEQIVNSIMRYDK